MRLTIVFGCGLTVWLTFFAFFQVLHLLDQIYHVQGIHKAGISNGSEICLQLGPYWWVPPAILTSWALVLGLRREFSLRAFGLCGSVALFTCIFFGSFLAIGALLPWAVRPGPMSEQEAPANGSQPARFETNRTSGADGSRR